MSSSKAEFVATSQAGQEVLYLRGLLEGFACLQHGPTGIWEDDASYILKRNPTNRERSRHVDVRVHFLRDMVGDGSVKLIKYARTQNVADALTKSLPQPASSHKHREFLKGTAQSFSAFFAGLSHKKGQSFLLQSPFEVYWWIMFISIATGGARSRLSHEPNRSKPARTKTEKYRFYFIKDGWGAEGSSYKHHSVSQRTDCLVPSQVCSNSVKGHWD